MIDVGNQDKKRLGDAEEFRGWDGGKTGAATANVDVEASGVGGLRLDQHEIGHGVDGCGLLHLTRWQDEWACVV